MAATSLLERYSDGSMATDADREYRVTCFGRPVGGWHQTKDAAERYAVKRKLGSYDAGLRITFLGVEVRIEGRRR